MILSRSSKLSKLERNRRELKRFYQRDSIKEIAPIEVEEIHGLVYGIIQNTHSSFARGTCFASNVLLFLVDFCGHTALFTTTPYPQSIFDRQRRRALNTRRALCVEPAERFLLALER